MTWPCPRPDTARAERWRQRGAVVRIGRADRKPGRRQRPWSGRRERKSLWDRLPPEDGRIFTAAENGMVWLWGAGWLAHRELPRRQCFAGRIKSVALDPRASTSPWASANVPAFDLGGRTTAQTAATSDKVDQVTFSPDGSRS